MMNDMPSVNVILATYNGEEFVEKQLQSILDQTYDNITIFVRDDGSSDHTVDVVCRVAQENRTKKRIVLLQNEGKNLKCPGSFYEILQKCDAADYYSLCDQDDYWYPEKIERAVYMLQKYQGEQALLYYAACDYRDVDGNLIRKSPAQKNCLELSDVLYYTPGSGFTIVFNEQARKQFVLDVLPGEELHDRWLIRSCTCFGKVIYDERSCATHIRHENAVTAADAGNANLLINFFRNELFGSNAVQEKQYLQYFFDVYSESLSKEDQKLLTIFTEKNCFHTWCRKVFYPKRLRTRLAGEVLLRILFLCGKI